MENNNQNMQEFNNSRSKEQKMGAIIIIPIILFLFLIASVGYVVYDKFYKVENDDTTLTNAENKNPIIETNTKEIDISDNMVTSLYNTMTKATGHYCGVDEYFKDKVVTSNDISNTLAYEVALEKMNSDGIINLYNNPTNFTAGTLNLVIKSIFGNNYNFVNQTYSTCPLYNYNSQTQNYEYIGAECGGTCVGETKKLVRAVQNDNKIELYVKVIFSGNTIEQQGKYYKDYNKTEEISVLNDGHGNIVDGDANFNNASLYKMVFTKEDSNYVFTSSNLAQ